ncbi:MAG: class I SAM-dependent methyltransferase [Myxococcota bacterium]|nr:class I SAM-dependent methyltransferase [Myxococcota bacterium]
MDAELFEHYVQRGAEPWNVSVDAAWLDYELRAWTAPRLPAQRPLAACNIGIGVGLWDDWLGHELGEGAQLTSVDRDPTICRVFGRRQVRERHPFPSQVVCGDILDGVLPRATFDVITVVGSTIDSNEPGAFEEAARAALAPGGVLLMARVGTGSPPITGELRQRGELWIAVRALAAPGA